MSNPSRPTARLLVAETFVAFVLALPSIVEWLEQTPARSTILLATGVAALGVLYNMHRVLSFGTCLVTSLFVVYVTLLALTASHPCFTFI